MPAENPCLDLGFLHCAVQIAHVITHGLTKADSRANGATLLQIMMKSATQSLFALLPKCSHIWRTPSKRFHRHWALQPPMCA